MRPTDFWTKYHSPQEIVVKLATVPLLAQRLLLCSDVYCLSVIHWRPQDCKTKSLSSKWFCWGDQIWNRFVSPPCATKTHIFTSNYPLVPSPFLNLEKKILLLLLSKCLQIPFTFHRVTQPSLDTVTEHCMTIIFTMSRGNFPYFYFYLFIYLLALTHSMWDPSSSTRNWIWALGSESTES